MDNGNGNPAKQISEIIARELLLYTLNKVVISYEDVKVKLMNNLMYISSAKQTSF